VNGVYIHSPLEQNPDSYKLENGDTWLYWYVSEGLGFWRTTDGN